MCPAHPIIPQIVWRKFIQLGQPVAYVIRVICQGSDCLRSMQLGMT